MSWVTMGQGAIQAVDSVLCRGVTRRTSVLVSSAVRLETFTRSRNMINFAGLELDHNGATEAWDPLGQ